MCPKGIKVQRTFPFGYTCFPWMVSVGTEGFFFAKYFYFFGLEPAHDLFSAAVKCTLLGRIRIFYSSLYRCIFFFIFCVVKSVNGLKKIQERLNFHFSLGFVFVMFFAWFSLTPGTKGSGWLLFMQNHLILIKTPGFVELFVLRAPYAAGRRPDRPRPERI